MSRYPFAEKAQEYMASRRGCIKDNTWKVQSRRYKRIEMDLMVLNKAGRVSTLSPKHITPEDVREYIVSRKDAGVGNSDLKHDITALNQLLKFSSNNAVEVCMTKYEGIKPTGIQPRLKPLPLETYQRILAKSSEVDQSDFAEYRPYAMVLMYICTGARNKELRFAKVTDLNTRDWTIYLEHVKGEGKYGQPRTVPIPEEIRPVVEHYLMLRQVWLTCHKVKSDALFFAMGGDHSFMSDNSIRRLKGKVEDAIGEKFELRDCRRACGQFYLDKGLTIEEVARLLGHFTSKTTETYYCRKNNADVARKAKGVW